jgi:galactokinase
MAAQAGQEPAGQESTGRPDPLSLAAAFTALTGQAPEGIWSAPGRVNLIGEHTDYNDGYVLPFALAARTAAAAARRSDERLTVHSLQWPGAVVDVPVPDLRPGCMAGPGAYAAGVVWAMRDAGHRVGGLDIVIDGAVPVGSGLSSSAALECAAALAVATLSEIRLAAAELARLAQRAENEFVGVPCGIMDQMASMLARAGHALFLDCRTGVVEHVPFDPAQAGLVLLVIDTHAHHELADSGYADRFAGCAEAARLLGVTALRDVPEAGLPEALARLAPFPVLARRVRHVVTENARVLATAELLRAGRLAAIGPILTASHQSLRDDFEVSAPELDTAVSAALSAGALGARMTGGGFGGSAIALAPVATVPAIRAMAAAAARQAAHPSPTIWPAVPSAGAHRDVLAALRGAHGR